MLDFCAKAFLSFSHDTVIIPLVVLGYVWLNKETFYHAICLLLFSMVCNFVLKVTFKVPGYQGFAFPSGHMQSSVVFYGWLMAKIPQAMVRVLLVALLIGIGLSLVHLGYHDYGDVFGALLVGVLLIALMGWFLQTPYVQQVKRARLQSHFKHKMLVFAFFLLSSVFLIYIKALNGSVPNHVWMAYYALVGLMSAEWLFGKKHKVCEGRSVKIVPKILATGLCVGGILLVKVVLVSQLQWLLIGFWLPFSVYLAGRFYV